jgi:(R,R)-butanediol dehydrogenase / meso-butanediol dehydrogenase / diacetyl reductase
MRAAVYHGPRDVRVEDVAEPGEPGPGEVLLRVLMGSLCGTDAGQYERATMVPIEAPHPSSGHRGPVILGHEVVGTVIAVGPGVEDLAVGQRVVPGSGWWCGDCPRCREGRINICERYYLMGIHADGGLTELARFPAKMCVPVPEGCSNPAAAMSQPCAVALHALGRGRVAEAQTVALFGAGSIGSLLLAEIQAEATGDRQVIVVDVEPGRLETARQLGAAHVVDARDGDPAARVQELSGGRGVDVAIEATGVPESIANALAATRRGGRVLQVGIPHQPLGLALESAVIYEKEILTTNGQVCGVDLPRALDLLATTELAERVGYRLIDLEAVVEEGLIPLVEHRAAAKIVINVARD